MSLAAGVPSSAIIAAWEDIVLDRAPTIQELDSHSLHARAHKAALELHVELLDVCVKALDDMAEELHTRAAESLDRTVSAWELLSSRLPDFDGLDALLVHDLTPNEYQEAMSILADEHLVRRTEKEHE